MYLQSQPNSLPVLLGLVLLLIASAACVPKFDEGGSSGNGFKPSAIDYADKSAKSEDKQERAGSEESAAARFGFGGVSDGGAGGGGYGVSSYAPARIDLGGLLLGAVIGIGTILVIPKLLYVLSGSYGAYARSEEAGIGQLMSRVDEALAGHGVDTTSCVQRLLCSYSRRDQATANSAAPDNRIDQQHHQHKQQQQPLASLLEALASNQMLAGTAVQEAISAGRNGHNCQRLYRNCGFSAEAVLATIAKLATATTPKTAAPTKTP